VRLPCLQYTDIMLKSLMNNVAGTDEKDVERTREDSFGSEPDRSQGSQISPHVWSRAERKLTKNMERELSLRDLTANDMHTLRALDERRKRAILNFDVDRRELDRLAVLLRAKLHLSVHRRIIHSYEDCFRGADAITWLVSNSICTDSEDARNIMRHLMYRQIILRVDHTKPLLNSAIHSMAPSIAEWRRRKQLDWYQTGSQKYHMSALYTFNVSAFAKYKLVVRLVSGRGLRYTRHNRILGKWEPKRIAPLASVTVGVLTANTSVEEKTSDPKWDETFTFFFDYTLARHNEVWIKVFDFREVGESMPLGVLCVPTKRILKQCNVDQKRMPPIFVQDAPGWLSWHPLLPPATSREPDEVRGGEIQVEFQVISNIVHSPDATVHDECRPRQDEEFIHKTTIDTQSVSRTDSEHHSTSPSTQLPRSVLAYQHVDRRPEKEIYASRAILDAESADREPSTVSKPGASILPLLGKTSDPKSSAPAPGTVQVDCWQTCITSLEIHNVTDIQSGSVVWIEVVARSAKRSEYMAKKNANNKSRRRDIDSNPGVVARRRSTRFVWPKDGRPVVKAGSVEIPIPDDVAKYTTLEFRLIKRKELPSNVVIGRGKLGLQRVRRVETTEDDTDDEDSDVGTQVDSDEEDTQNLDDDTASNKVSSLRTPSVLSIISDDDKSAVPSVDDLKPQAEIDPTNQDVQYIVLRKQAAFKRNIKIKCGQIYCYARMRPLLPDEALELEDDLASIGDGGREMHVEIEDALKAVIPSDPDEVPEQIDIPSPFANIYIDENVPGSVQQLATAILGSNSKFAIQFNKERKNSNYVMGPWKIPRPSMDETKNDDNAADNAESESEDDKEATDSEKSPSPPTTAKTLSNNKNAVLSSSKISSSTSSDSGSKIRASSEVSVTSNKRLSDASDLLPDASFSSLAGSMFDEKRRSQQRPPLAVDTQSEAVLRKDSDHVESAKSKKSGSEGDSTEAATPAILEGVSATAGGPSSPAVPTTDSSQAESSKRPALVRQESIHAARAGDYIDSVAHPTREITFMLPNSGLIKGSECKETQKILTMNPGGFVVLVAQETPGVPYGERFHTQVQFVITYVSPTESHLRISGEVVWNEGKMPSGMIKPFIINGVKNGHAEAYVAETKLLREWMTKSRQVRPKAGAKKSKGDEDDAAKKESTKAKSACKLCTFLLLFAIIVPIVMYIVAVIVYSAFSDLNFFEVVMLHRDVIDKRLALAKFYFEQVLEHQITGKEDLPRSLI